MSTQGSAILDVPSSGLVARAEGGGAKVLGSPLTAFRHLVREMARYGGEPLGPGDIVTTGTLVGALPASAGAMHAGANLVCGHTEGGP